MTQLSVITINLNNSAGLKKTIESVVSQTFQLFEFIIIDGGSTDSSGKVIEEYSKHLTYWVSEPDCGIYHAMNKGIKVAKGRYCLFLNSGDWLVKHTVLADVFSENLTADIIAGDVYYYDNQRNTIQWHVVSPDVLSAKILFQGSLPHQSTFIRRALFENIGYYNESLRIASDWLFFVEALLEKGCSYTHYQGVVSYFNMDGISCNPATDSLPKREQLSVLQQKYPLFLADYDRLAHLEEQSNRWSESREYLVFTYFQKIGLIQAGVFCLRLFRFLKRKMAFSR
ncbi:glycosyltransferase family 2 protein [Runella aurantiaca]|uniref:Glycosyltransferase n=1 Tax=Runella aurantiaca TaxID=2282308 RepID=A0A369I3P0_9BACT|nr:glycosyltransferase family 2 protein [Runella aurantiaca]RDB04339.1 glycosyltransferase [Runella aurantiaca]